MRNILSSIVFLAMMIFGIVWYVENQTSAELESAAHVSLPR